MTKRQIAAALAVPAITAGLLAATAGAATAANGTIGERETVCADSLYVRETAPHGAFHGTLFRGQTFTVQQRQGDYVYGFAYGHINRNGWVQDGWFC